MPLQRNNAQLRIPCASSEDVCPCFMLLQNLRGAMHVEPPPIQDYASATGLDCPQAGSAAFKTALPHTLVNESASGDPSCLPLRTFLAAILSPTRRLPIQMHTYAQELTVNAVLVKDGGGPAGKSHPGRWTSSRAARVHRGRFSSVCCTKPTWWCRGFAPNTRYHTSMLTRGP
ncbi:uncharacterized protein LOC144111982 [Amblyomma americanum]